MNWNWKFRAVWMLCLGVNDMRREMKDSGVEWIGEIPEDWKITKLKYLGTYINGYAFKPDDWGDTGIRIIRIQDLTGSNDKPNYYSGNLDNKYLIKKGDILVSWAATLDAFIWKKNFGWLNQHIFKALPNEEMVSPEYFFWLLKVVMENMNNDNKHGIFMQHVTLDVFNNFETPLPSKSEQNKIHQFLQNKVDIINLLVEKTRLCMNDYKKMKETLVIQTVTKGIYSKRKMKNTNIEWLEEIPFDWKECRIKNVIFPVIKEVNDTDEIVTCFRDGTVTLRKNRREDGFTISFTEKGYHGVDKGDLVIHGMDAFAGAIGCSDSRGKITPVVHVCKTTGNNRYFMYFLRSMAYGNILMDLSNGVRIRSSDYRNFAKLGIFRICVPPLEEQNLIVEFLDRKVNEIEKIVEKKQIFCQELEAYKKSLIYEYVTGKKEVPED